MSKPVTDATKPDYGVDAPAVMRNLFVFGALSLLLALFTPKVMHFGKVDVSLHGAFYCMAAFLLVQAFSFLFYVKAGKLNHRDYMLSLRAWRGDERVLDVGCGRGLLLAGAARKLRTGHATGLDIWSNVDMGANSAAATERNLELEGVAARCDLVSKGAEAMPFPDASFDVIVSNLCLHNIYDRPTRRKALHEIVRVLAPGGVALISDYKLTGEYAEEFGVCGLMVERRWSSLWTTFPTPRIVIARKTP